MISWLKKCTKEEPFALKLNLRFHISALHFPASISFPLIQSGNDVDSPWKIMSDSRLDAMLTRVISVIFTWGPNTYFVNQCIHRFALRLKKLVYFSRWVSLTLMLKRRHHLWKRKTAADPDRLPGPIALMDKLNITRKTMFILHQHYWNEMKNWNRDLLWREQWEDREKWKLNHERLYLKVIGISGLFRIISFVFEPPALRNRRTVDFCAMKKQDQ